MTTAITWPFIVCICILTICLIGWLIYAHKKDKLTLEWCKSANSGSTRETELWRVLSEPRLGSIRSVAVYRTVVTLFCWYLLLHAGFSRNFYNYRNFTVWNWVQLTAFYTLSSLMSWLHFLETHYNHQMSLNWCGWIKSHAFVSVIWTLYQIQCANTLFVDIIAWCLLYPFATTEQRETYLLTWFSINMHTTNFIIIYTDLFTNQIPINIHYAALAQLFALIYVLFQWIWVQFDDNEFSYPFLDTRELYHLFFYCGLFGIGIFFFQCAVWFTNFRNRKFPLENFKPINPKANQTESVPNSTCVKSANIEIIAGTEVEPNL